MKLKGKVAIVTGASSGMGRAISMLFAKEGASVVAVARRVERLEELSTESEALDGEILPFPGDVLKKEDIVGMVDFALEKFGKLDILVNNAGIMDEMMPVTEASDELWDRVLGVNLTGPFYSCKKAVTHMLEQGKGNIINIGSIGGLNGSRAGIAYTASKFGLTGLTKNVAFMYADKGIRCNVICPGAVNTEIAVGIKSPSELGMSKAQSGMGTNPRVGSPEEIANVALFLASDDSSFINGATIVADSGWTAY